MNDQSKKTPEEEMKTTKWPIRDLKPLSKEVPKESVIVKTTASSLREEYTQTVRFWESLVSLDNVTAKKTLEDLILETALWESKVSRRFSFSDVEAWKGNRLQDVEELFKDWENSHNGCADASKADCFMSRFAIKLHEVFMRRRFIEVDVLAKDLNIEIEKRKATIKGLSDQLETLGIIAADVTDLPDAFYKVIRATRTIIERLKKELKDIETQLEGQKTLLKELKPLAITGRKVKAGASEAAKKINEKYIKKHKLMQMAASEKAKNPKKYHSISQAAAEIADKYDVGKSTVKRVCKKELAPLNSNKRTK